MQTMAGFRVECFRGGRWFPTWIAEEFLAADYAAGALLRRYIAVRVVDLETGRYVFESYAGGCDEGPEAGEARRRLGPEVQP